MTELLSDADLMDKAFEILEKVNIVSLYTPPILIGLNFATLDRLSGLLSCLLCCWPLRHKAKQSKLVRVSSHRSALLSNLIQNLVDTLQ